MTLHQKATAHTIRGKGDEGTANTPSSVYTIHNAARELCLYP